MRRAALGAWMLCAWTLIGCTGREGGDGRTAVPKHGIGIGYARHFTITLAADDTRLVAVIGDHGDTLARYHLVRADDEVRTVPGTITLRVPLKRVVLASTTHVPFLSALSALPAIAGVAHAAQVREPGLQARLLDGSTWDVGAAQGLDRERVLMIRPDAVFTYPFGGGLDPLPGVRHIPIIQVTEYLEQDPLGRAEWILFFGALFDREREADSLFQAIVRRYEQARVMVDTVTAPTVFYGSAWQGEWSVPSGDSYMARLIADAGGRYLFAQQHAAGNITLAREQVITYGMQADHWGRLLAQEAPVTALDVAGGDTRLLALPAFRNGRLFQCNSATNDIFGRAALEPDVLLRDLRCIFHPARCGGHVPVYFRPVLQ